MNYGTIGRDVWESPEFGDLTPEEKFFALWTITAPQTRKCGCWPLNKNIAVAETGFNKDTIDKLVSRLQEAGWLRYDQTTREVLIIDWGRRNAGLFRPAAAGSKRPNFARQAIIEEAKNIKSLNFREIVFNWLDSASDVVETIPTQQPSTDAPSMPDKSPIDGACDTNTATDTSTAPELLTEQSYLSGNMEKTPPHIRLFDGTWAGRQDQLSKIANDFPLCDIYLMADQIDYQHFMQPKLAAQRREPTGLLMSILQGSIKYVVYDGYCHDWREKRNERVKALADSSYGPRVSSEPVEPDDSILDTWNALTSSQKNEFKELLKVSKNPYLCNCIDNDFAVAMAWRNHISGEFQI